MTKDNGSAAWEVLIDRDRIRGLAETNEVVPRIEHRTSGKDKVRISGGEEDDEGSRISWDECIDRLTQSGRVIRYRPPDGETGTGAVFEIVGRDELDEGADIAEEVEDQIDAEGEHFATSDTGDSEPVGVNKTTSDRPDPNNRTGTAAKTSEHTASGSATVGVDLVLDEIHEDGVAFGSDVDDEYLVFRNEGDVPIDLSGWTVENDADRSYRFSDRTVLKPGERITLHSGEGNETRGHRYWNAEEPVWGNQRDTVIVRTAEGDRVLREAYEA